MAKDNKEIQYASLTVNSTITPEKDFKEIYHKLDISLIAWAQIRISGHDIYGNDEPCSPLIPLSSKKNDTKFTIEKVPCGKDRIVTVTVYDADLNQIPNMVIRAVADIEYGKENSVIIGRHTTSFGNILFRIRNIFDFEELEKDGRMNSIRAVVDSEIHPSLFDSEKLIGELQGFSFPYNATKEDYRLFPGTIKFDYLIADDFSIQIDDPLSQKVENQGAAIGIEIPGIAPGNWGLSILDKNGKTLDKTEIQIESGKTSSIGHLEHNGIAILVPDNIEKSDFSYSDLKYDEIVPENERLSENSEKGFVKNLSKKIRSKNNHFYLFDFKKASSLNLLLDESHKNDSQKTDKDEASEKFFASQKGVYRFDSNKLILITKPQSEQEILQGLNITDENFRKCFIDDLATRRFVVLFSEDLYGSRPSSVKAEFNKGINDHDGAYKGKHYKMTRHKDGFWYCSIPFGDVQQTNQAGQPTYNFKVDDTIINPPSFVPNGYIYQKFTGSFPQKQFLTLIYSAQNENEMTERLFRSKTCKYLKDFNLSTEEGKMQIANFRLVPGSKKLFRSYHPYADDKKEISDTSRMRMKCVAELSEKAGIKADINLSDTKPGNATYEMPKYFQRIMDNDAVLYMTDCSYNECYENSNSPKFAKGIKKIVEFINQKEGPYQIHCRIGTDRTGIVCAVISALCGAPWNEIEDDYCASIKMGIYEYRGPGAMRYAIQHMIDAPILEDVDDIQKAVTDHFVKGGYLTKDQIDTMIKRLQ